QDMFWWFFKPLLRLPSHPSHPPYRLLLMPSTPSPSPLPVARKGKSKRLKADDYDRLLTEFSSPIAALDCGRICAPLNGGEPVCCTTANAVPVLDRGEWELFRSRTDLWSKFQPQDAAGRAIVAEAGRLCVAAECKGASLCERDNRSLSCRAFPFAPYIDRDGNFSAISYYWGFADRCWVISNLHIATPQYLREFFIAYDRLFARDHEEWLAHKDNSITMRRMHSRKRQRFAIVARDFSWKWVRPYGRGVVEMQDPAREMKAFGPYRSPATYRAAVARAEGEVTDAVVKQAFATRNT
ncbi:MAG: hypothetical protein OD811_05315, partial [Alphaproteobacteria bacterium]